MAATADRRKHQHEPTIISAWAMQISVAAVVQFLQPRLKTLGIEPPSRVQLAEAALQRQLEMVACAS